MQSKDMKMAAKNSGFLVRQLLSSNRSKLIAALLPHQTHLYNPIATLTSIPKTQFSPQPASSPSFSPPSNPHSLQNRPLSSSSGPSNIVPINSEDGLKTALSKAEEGSVPSVFYFTAVWCGPCKFISPVIGELSEKYPQVTTYKIDIDEKSLGGMLRRLNIFSVPTFHFFQNGKKAAEVVGADAAHLKDTFAKLYKPE